MRFTGIFFTSLFIPIQVFSQVNKSFSSEIHIWEDPQVSGINSLPARIPSFLYPNEAAALKNEKETSG